MITSIKKIKDVGVFKDFETRRTGLQKDFCKKNFVFGPNTYGKSTLCDILKDISDNSTERINKRLSIPNGAAQDEAKAEEFDKQFPYKEKLKLPGQLV